MKKLNETPQSPQPEFTVAQFRERLAEFKPTVDAKARELTNQGNREAIRLCRKYGIPYELIKYQKAGLGSQSPQSAPDYLRILNDAVTPDVWGKIVAAALEKAGEGDEKAHAWLRKYISGESLSVLARLCRKDGSTLKFTVDFAKRKPNGR